MATYKADLTLTSTNLTSDNMSVAASITNTSANYGGVVKQLLKSATNVALFDKDAYSEGAIVYIMNADSAGTVTVSITAAEEIVLRAGEWAAFPWGDRTTDINVKTDQAAGRAIEWGVFN